MDATTYHLLVTLYRLDLSNKSSFEILRKMCLAEVLDRMELANQEANARITAASFTATFWKKK